MRKFKYCFALVPLLLGISLSTYANTYTVQNANDSGKNSLRDAITKANAVPTTISNAHVIRFRISTKDPNCIDRGTGYPVCTISLNSSLPSINVPMIIDGGTQPLTANAPIGAKLIEINGAGVPVSNTVQGPGFWIKSGGAGSIIKNLVINRFPDQGIFLDNTQQVVVDNNYIGLDASGSVSSNTTTAYGNGQANIQQRRVGLGILNSHDSIISRNTLSGNGIANIFLYKSADGLEPHDNLIVSNNIGTDKTGLTRQDGWRRTQQGIYIAAGKNNVVRQNVITGTNKANQIGLVIDDNENLIESNFIGVGRDGETVVANQTGIKINGSDNTITANIISGNVVGIALIREISTLFGSDPYTPPENVIQNNKIIGNLIGVTKSLKPKGNANVGIQFSARASNNLVSFNIIANNGLNSIPEMSGGIVLSSLDENRILSTNHPVGNKIVYNSIFSNAMVGIDLVNKGIFDVIRLNIKVTDGPTLNDSVGHNGPNNFQNYPVIQTDQSSTKPYISEISGSLDSYPNESYLIQFFGNQDSDFTLFNISFLDSIVQFKSSQGQVFLGEMIVTTDSNGHVDFRKNLLNSPQIGNLITSTATRLSTNDTSEFSMAYSFTTPPTTLSPLRIDAEGNYDTEHQFPRECLTYSTTKEIKSCIKEFLKAHNYDKIYPRFMDE